MGGRNLVLEGRSLVLEGTNLVEGKNQAEDMHHPGGNLEQVEGIHQPVGNLEQEGMHRPGGIQLADNLDQEEEVDSHHKAAHMLVVVHIQQEAA